jgi:hypothetical protein
MEALKRRLGVRRCVAGRNPSRCCQTRRPLWRLPRGPLRNREHPCSIQGTESLPASRS